MKGVPRLPSKHYREFETLQTRYLHTIFTIFKFIYINICRNNKQLSHEKQIQNGQKGSGCIFVHKKLYVGNVAKIKAAHLARRPLPTSFVSSLP